MQKYFRNIAKVWSGPSMQIWNYTRYEMNEDRKSIVCQQTHRIVQWQEEWLTPDLLLIAMVTVKNQNTEIESQIIIFWLVVLLPG